MGPLPSRESRHLLKAGGGLQYFPLFQVLCRRLQHGWKFEARWRSFLSQRYQTIPAPRFPSDGGIVPPLRLAVLLHLRLRTPRTCKPLAAPRAVTDSQRLRASRLRCEPILARLSQPTSRGRIVEATQFSRPTTEVTKARSKIHWRESKE